MNAALASILARYPPSARPTREPTALGNAGGLSGARIWRFESHRGPLAARLWPGADFDRAAIERIHGWLSRAAHLGFVPVPIAGRDGRTVQQEGGHLWEVVPWMTGTADLSTAPPRRRVAAAFAAMAAFHVAMREVTPRAASPGLSSRLAEIDSLLARDLSAWRAIVDRDATDPEAKSLASRWLDLASQLAPAITPEIRRAASRPVAIQPVIRDARPDHFLFTGDCVTGLVDFGAMGVDAVSTDLARLMGEWIGDDAGLRDEAIAAYSAVRPLSAAESSLIAAFEGSAAILGGARWVRWHFLDDVTFSDPRSVVSGLRRAVARLDRLAASAQGGPDAIGRAIFNPRS